MRYAYDLDGTLAFTKEAVYAAYKSVGVDPPKDFYYKPWNQWMDEDVHEKFHEAKNIVYGRIARELVRPTPLVDLYMKCPGQILTGASLSGANITLAAVSLYPTATDVHCGLSLHDKAVKLLEIGDGEPGIYFDDDLEAVKFLREKTGWTTIFVKF